MGCAACGPPGARENTACLTYPAGQAARARAAARLPGLGTQHRRSPRRALIPGKPRAVPASGQAGAAGERVPSPPAPTLGPCSPPFPQGPDGTRGEGGIIPGAGRATVPAPLPLASRNKQSFTPGATALRRVALRSGCHGLGTRREPAVLGLRGAGAAARRPSAPCFVCAGLGGAITGCSDCNREKADPCSELTPCQKGNNRQALEREAPGNLPKEPTKQIIYTLLWQPAGAAFCEGNKTRKGEREAERGEGRLQCLLRKKLFLSLQWESFLLPRRRVCALGSPGWARSDSTACQGLLVIL